MAEHGHKITADHLERAEERIRAAYMLGMSPREAHDRIAVVARFEGQSMENYILAHLEITDKHLKDAKTQEEARRIMATFITHHLAVGALAQRISEGRNW